MELTQLRYTLKEAAKLLRLSPVTLMRRIQHGYIYAIKDGKAWFIPCESLERYARSGPLPKQLRRAG